MNKVIAEEPLPLFCFRVLSFWTVLRSYENDSGNGSGKFSDVSAKVVPISAESEKELEMKERGEIQEEKQLLE